MRGLRIHITGVVQGVGFRPFVHNLAQRYQIKGWVRNTSAGVDIHVDGEPAVLEQFITALQAEAPPLSRIDEFSRTFEAPSGFNSFEIIHSEAVAGAFQPISPDVAVCNDCLRELFDPSDRRYRYPFINCTNCGPRFTIIKDIPYDRPKTTMASFPMCPDCAAEYRNPSDRRFHAQPVACPVCGPKVWIERGKEKQDFSQQAHSPLAAHDSSSTNDEAIQESRTLLSKGKILAVKGLGGFHLACDAGNIAAVSELRVRKLRVDKPFAVMLPDLEGIEKHCHVNDDERALLLSTARPIVLLKRKSTSTIAHEVAPGQDWLGVMLPYTPLHHLLLAPVRGLEKAPGFPEALVMTSGNLSEEPIAIGNDEARDRLSSLADAFLLHNRDIHIRCDDSVVRVFDDNPKSEIADHKGPAGGKSVYPLRRSRGYAPFPVKLPRPAPALLAAGPQLKNTFCMTNKNYAFLSHHIGDMENYETLRSFEEGITHFERLFRVRPEAIAHDLHPDYLSTRYAIERAQKEALPAIAVQHHHAHIAACMAEHGLDGAHPVIGLALDGTGYGQDGAIWGGEILIADYKGYQRASHLEYFPLPGGDAAIKKPARCALALLWSLGLGWDARLAPVAAFSENDRSNLRIQLEHRINTPLTSSVGRLFDAAAALAGVRQIVNYEAQAAIEFEAQVDAHENGTYPFEAGENELHVRAAFELLLSDILAGVSLPIISARFHNGLAAVLCTATLQIRAKTGLNEVALSGGVWQNITLLRRTLSLLQVQGFKVYIHREAPTNDGGVALGQAVIAANRLSGESNVPRSTSKNP